MTYDDTDRRIIEVLQSHSKLSYRDIAKKVGVSSVTALNRVKRLEKDKIIKRYTVEADLDRLGYQFQAIIEVQTKERILELEKRITSHKNVSHTFETTGEFDLVIITRFKDRSGLDVFIKDLKAIDAVSRIKSKIILNSLKEGTIGLC